MLTKLNIDMTRQEILDQTIDFSKPIDLFVLKLMIPVAMKAYAEQEVKKALEAAAEKGTIWTNVDTHGDHECTEGIQDWEIEFNDEQIDGTLTISAHLNKESILNAYKIED